MIQLRKHAKTFFPHRCAKVYKAMCLGTWGSHQGVSCAWALLPCALALLHAHGRFGQPRGGKFYNFPYFFRAFFLLEMPLNLGWILHNFYCLQKPFIKNHWSSFSISLDPSCDALLCRFTWSLTKKTQNTYEVAWFRIKMNYKGSNEKNTKCSSIHGQLL